MAVRVERGADAAVPCPRGLEYANAKMRMVRINPIEVRGITEAGRCVSCAACEIDSKPTKEMMASDTPFISWNHVGQLVVIV